MTTAAELAALRTSLLRFLFRERSAYLQDLDEIWSAPLSTRVAGGDALERGRLVETLGEARWVLEFPENASRFRPGDRLRVGDGEDPGAEPEVMLIEEDPASRRLVVGLPWGVDRHAVEAAVGGAAPLVLDRGETDLLERIVQGLERTFRGRGPVETRLRDLLAGGGEAPADPAARESAEASADRLAALGVLLDASQREAFVAAWAAPTCQLVQGPPGTGKTWLLALLTAALAWRGERILITAFTHRAVDNALAQLSRVFELFDRRLPVVRVNPRKNTVWSLEQAGIEAAWGAGKLRLPPRGGAVVGATVFTALGFEPGAFHRVMMDEAAQVPLAHAPCGLLAGRRWVLFGDDRQLGPVVVGDHPGHTRAHSVFAHLRGARPPAMLECTYRLCDLLCTFPSEAFYEGRLRPSSAAASRRFPARPGGRFDGILDAEPAAVLVSVNHEGYRTHAPPEVECAVDLAEELLVHTQIHPEEMAIVGPFRRQNLEIGRALARRLGGEADLPLVDTVERIQGQEREVVIVSLTCSDPDALRRDSRFFFSPHRLCVSLTRARTKLIVIGSEHLLRTLPHSQGALEDFDLFCRLFRDLPRFDLTDDYLPRSSGS